MIQKKEQWAEHYSALELFKAEIMTLAKKDPEDAGVGAASTIKIWHYTDVAGHWRLSKAANYGSPSGPI